MRSSFYETLVPHSQIEEMGPFRPRYSVLGAILTRPPEASLRCEGTCGAIIGRIRKVCLVSYRGTLINTNLTCTFNNVTTNVNMRLTTYIWMITEPLHGARQDVILWECQSVKVQSGVHPYNPSRLPEASKKLRYRRDLVADC